MDDRVAVVAGHICLDITPELQTANNLADLLTPGRLLRVGPADVHTGGCVANTGMALQKFGVSTRLVARVEKAEAVEFGGGVVVRDTVDPDLDRVVGAEVGCGQSAARCISFGG